MTTDKQTYGQTDIGERGRQTDRQTNRQTDRQTDRHRQTDRQTDRLIDRQIERKSKKQTILAIIFSSQQKQIHLTDNSRVGIHKTS